MKQRALVLVASLILACVTPAFAGIYGPMASPLQGGQASFGLGYAYSNLSIEDYPFELLQHQVYAQLGLGLGGKWEIYLRGGGASMLVEKAYGTEDARDGLRPFGAAGFKGPLYDGQVLDVALFAQGSYFDEYSDTFSDGVDSVELTLTDLWEASGGIAFELVIEGAQLYAGPFYYHAQTDAEQSVNAGPAAEDTLKSEANVGGFVGINWPLISGWHLNVEGQIRKNYLAGMALNYPF